MTLYQFIICVQPVAHVLFFKWVRYTRVKWHYVPLKYVSSNTRVSSNNTQWIRCYRIVFWESNGSRPVSVLPDTLKASIRHNTAENTHFRIVDRSKHRLKGPPILTKKINFLRFFDFHKLNYFRTGGIYIGSQKKVLVSFSCHIHITKSSILGLLGGNFAFQRYGNYKTYRKVYSTYGKY